jgi:hypothetical protein
MSRFRTFSTAFAFVLLASPVAAQRVTDSPSTRFDALATVQAPVTVAPTPAAAPSLASVEAAAPVGARLITVASPLAPAPIPRDVGRNPALMIVGGAMMIVGAVVGGDSGTLIMIGGGGIGLFGLWQFLR